MARDVKSVNIPEGDHGKPTAYRLLCARMHVCWMSEVRGYCNGASLYTVGEPSLAVSELGPGRSFNA